MTVSDQICKKGLIYISNITLSKIYNSDCVTPTAWKFGRGIYLLLHLYERKFQHYSILTTEAMPLQSW